MSRLEASPGLKKQIRHRYSNQCAACGAASELTADVAHLFEDATTLAPRKDTLIVLCSGCNEAEDRAKSPSKPALVELFSADNVLARASRSYRMESTVAPMLVIGSPPICSKGVVSIRRRWRVLSRPFQRCGQFGGETS